MPDTNDDWGRAVTFYTGYQMPSRATLFDNLKSDDKIPLFTMKTKVKNVKFSVDPEEDKEDIGWIKDPDADYSLIYYTLGGDGAHQGTVKKHMVKITLIGVNPDPNKRADLLDGGQKYDLGESTGPKGENWDAAPMSQYIGGPQAALSTLLSNKTTRGLKYAGYTVQNPEAVDLLSFERTALAFDRTHKFFLDASEVIAAWEKALGKENSAWKGKAAGVFWHLIHQLNTNYKDYAKQMGAPGDTKASKAGVELRLAKDDLVKEVENLNKAWTEWTNTLQHDPHRPVLELLNDLVIWINENNAKHVFWRKVGNAVSFHTDENFKETHPDYGKLDDVQSWIKIGEKAITIWNQHVDEKLSPVARDSMSKLRTSWVDRAVVFEEPLTTKDERSLTDTYKADLDGANGNNGGGGAGGGGNGGLDPNDLKDIFNRFGDGIGENFKKFTDNLGLNLKNLTGNIGDGFKNVAENIGGGFGNFNKNLLKLGGGIGDLGENIGGAFAGLGGGIGDLGENIGNNFNALGNNIGGAIGNLSNPGNPGSVNFDPSSLLNGLGGVGGAGAAGGVVGAGGGVGGVVGAGGGVVGGGNLGLGLPNGSSSPTGTGSTMTNPDGSTTHLNPDGTLTTTYPDGSTLTYDPATGTVTTTGPDGTVSTTPLKPGESFNGPNGSVITRNPDGTLTTTFPDGTSTTVNPLTGATTTHHPDGSVTQSSLGENLSNGIGTSSLPNIPAGGGTLTSPSSPLGLGTGSLGGGTGSLGGGSGLGNSGLNNPGNDDPGSEEYDPSDPFSGGSLGAPATSAASATAPASPMSGGMPMNPGGMGNPGAGGSNSNSERVRKVLDETGGASLRRPQKAKTKASGADEEEEMVLTRATTPTSSPYLPMGGGNTPAGQGDQATNSGDRERASWVPEDEDVWGTDNGAAPAVIG